MTGTTTEKKKVATETMALWVSIMSFLIAVVAATFAVYIWYVGRIESLSGKINLDCIAFGA
jgi:hypothetical protein